jgi:hypothetical protein
MKAAHLLLATVLFTGFCHGARADEEAQNKAWVAAVKDEAYKNTPVAGTLDGQPIAFNSVTYSYDIFGYRLRFQQSPSQAKPAIEIFLRTQDAIVGKTLTLPLPRVPTPYGPMPGSGVSKFTTAGDFHCPDGHSGRMTFVPSKDGYLVGYVVARASCKDMKQTWINGYFYAVPKSK